LRGLRLSAALLLAVVACGKLRTRQQPHELVFVTNEDSGTITLIDTESRSVVDTVHVGNRPRGVKVTADGARVLVALSGSPKGGPNVDEASLPAPDRTADGIGVVDVAKRQLLRVLPSGPDPEAFDLADGKLFISNEDTARASIVRERDGHLEASLPVGAEPEGVTVSPDGRFVYVTSESDAEVDIIDVQRRLLVARVKVGERPRAVAFLPNGSRAYVTNELSGSISVINTATRHAEQTIALPHPSGEAPPKPMGIVIAPDAEHAYVTTGRAGGVIELELRGNSVARTLSNVGARPWGIDISSDGKWLYVANGPSNDVAVIDREAWQVAQRIPVGRSPWGVAIARGSTR
jgi:YVTN family beta-propeller protein